MVGMSDFAHRNVVDLSAGERQRVNLARAVAIGPEAVLLDEPSANVDTRTVALIRNLLRRLSQEQGTTVIHTSPGNSQLHDIADRVVYIEAGRILKSDERPSDN
jgi:ABC-type multidrug transport system ATPase subunit